MPYYFNPFTSKPDYYPEEQGTGDVVGPNGATDNAVVRFDGASGLLLKNSTAILTDDADLTINSLSLTTDLPITEGGTGASSASDARTNLGLIIGTNVQAYNSGLQAISGLEKTDGNIIVGDGSTWVVESGSTARTSLGLGTIATQNSNNVTITGGSITGITDLAVADGGTGASTASNARTNLGLGTIAVENSPLDATKGGTGQSTFTTGNILYASATNTLSKLSVASKPGCFLTMGFDNEVIWFDPSLYFYIYDDFIGQTSNGQTNWRQTLTAGTARFTQDSLNNHPGELQYESDASSTAVMGISKIDVDGTGNYKAGAYRQYHEFLCKLSALSDGTDTYIFRVGLGNDRDLTTITQGCWFEYTHSVNSGNFTINCVNGGATSTGNTSTAATTLYTKYGIEINASGTSVKFTINGVEVANSPVVSQIPTGAFSPFFGLQKTVGTNERIMLIDYYYGFGKFTTPR